MLHYTYALYLLSTHLSMDSCVVHVLAIVDSAAVNMGECVFLSYGFLRVYAREWDGRVIW